MNVLSEKKAGESSPFPIDDKVRYVAVGRFAYQKGFDILIDAYALVSKKFPIPSCSSLETHHMIMGESLAF